MHENTDTMTSIDLELLVREEEERFLAWLDAKYQPLAGSDEDVDNDDDVDDDIDDSEYDDEDEDESQGESDDSEDDDSADESVEALRTKLAEEQERRIKAEQATRKAKKAERDKRAAEAQASGDLDAMKREHQAELDEMREELDAARETATVNEYTLDQERRTNRVNRLAQRLGFRDPGDAIALLTEDETESDKSTERALSKLAQKKPYLVDRKKTGRAMGGSGGVRLTMDDINGMTQEEINARWDEVSKVMQASGQS